MSYRAIIEQMHKEATAEVLIDTLNLKGSFMDIKAALAKEDANEKLQSIAYCIAEGLHNTDCIDSVDFEGVGRLLTELVWDHLQQENTLLISKRAKEKQDEYEAEMLEYYAATAGQMN